MRKFTSLSRSLAIASLMYTLCSCAPDEADLAAEDEEAEGEAELGVTQQAITSAGWSAWKKCNVSRGSDKQVRIEWQRTSSGITPYRIQWKTNSPGIPLKPVKKITTKFGGAGGQVQNITVPSAAASGQWIYDRFSGQRNVITENWLIESNGNTICFVEIGY